VADVLQEMGNLLVKLNQNDEAKNIWQKTLKIREAAGGREAPSTKETKASLKSIGVI